MSKRDRHDPRAKKLAFMMDGPWVARSLAMLESPAWQVLSLLERRFLDRLEIEYARNAGKENGRLVVTYDQLTQSIKRDYIAAVLRTVCALGFVEITEHGRGGPFKAPHRYRLTYQNVCGNGVYAEATNEWRAIKTLEEAKATAEKARDEKPKKGSRRNRVLVPKMGTPQGPKIGTPLPLSPVPKMGTPPGPQNGDSYLDLGSAHGAPATGVGGMHFAAGGEAPQEQNLPRALPTDERARCRGNPNGNPNKRKRTLLPADVVLSEQMLTHGRANGWSAEHCRDEFTKFTVHHRANRTRLKDWDDGWRSWVTIRRRLERMVA